MLEIVVLSFTRRRLFGDGVKPDQDPMESMIVVRATSMSNSEEEARRMLAPMSDLARADHAEVRIEIAPTSMAEEYGA